MRKFLATGLILGVALALPVGSGIAGATDTLEVQSKTEKEDKGRHHPYSDSPSCSLQMLFGENGEAYLLYTAPDDQPRHVNIFSYSDADLPDDDHVGPVHRHKLEVGATLNDGESIIVPLPNTTTYGGLEVQYAGDWYKIETLMDIPGCTPKPEPCPWNGDLSSNDPECVEPPTTTVPEPPTTPTTPTTSTTEPPISTSTTVPSTSSPSTTETFSPAATSETLPHTGSTTVPLIALGLILLATGGTVLAVKKRVS